MRGIRWAISGFALTLLALSIGASPAHAQAKKNKPPKVHLSAPEHRYVAPGSIPLTAEVTDRDDPIAKVEFFNGDALLATTTAAPYTFNWTNVAVGNYQVRAKATDARGATGTSNTFRVRVRDNAAPHVRILTPGNNATFPAPASIPISLRANDRDDNLTNVELLANGAPLATFSAAPYDFNWTNVPPGTYVLTARATDELGLTTTSRVVTVTVTGTTPNVPPTVSLTSPTDNASFTAPASIPLTAAAGDSDGTVAKVEFFFGSTLIATSTEAPYSAIWAGVPEGTYALTALVTDNLGASVSSSSVNITVARAEPKLYFIEVDHLNTPRRVSDAANTTVWLWDQQEPFGNNLPDENPSGLGSFDLPLRLPGQRFDTETNLHYNYFRDYDPGIGRYAESDPIGIYGGLNTYAYGIASPLLTTDYFGLCRIEVRYKVVPGIGRWTGAYHTYIVTTNPGGGTPTFFRGGPGGARSVSGPIWGALQTTMGPYTPGTPDWEERILQPVVLLDDDQPCACYDQSFTTTLTKIANSNIGYMPAIQNSNSTVGTALTQAGFALPSLPVTAPGFTNNLARFFRRLNQ